MSTAPRLVEETSPDGHVVQLCGQDENLLVGNVTRFLAEGLRLGHGILVVATPEHLEAFTGRLGAEGLDTAAPAMEGRLLLLDARTTLNQCLIDGQPDWKRFDATVGGAIRGLQRRIGEARARAYGEMVALLWQDQRYSAAVQLEVFWNQLLRAEAFSLFCSYPIDVFSGEFQISTLNALLSTHTHVLPANPDLQHAVDRALQEVLGSRVTEFTLLVESMTRPAWAEVPRAESIILWLRNLLPNHADEILKRARRYYHAAHLKLDTSDHGEG